MGLLPTQIDALSAKPDEITAFESRCGSAACHAHPTRVQRCSSRRPPPRRPPQPDPRDAALPLGCLPGSPVLGGQRRERTGRGAGGHAARVGVRRQRPRGRRGALSAPLLRGRAPRQGRRGLRRVPPQGRGGGRGGRRRPGRPDGHAGVAGAHRRGRQRHLQHGPRAGRPLRDAGRRHPGGPQGDGRSDEGPARVAALSPVRRTPRPCAAATPGHPGRAHVVPAPGPRPPGAAHAPAADAPPRGRRRHRQGLLLVPPGPLRAHFRPDGPAGGGRGCRGVQVPVPGEEARGERRLR